MLVIGGRNQAAMTARTPADEEPPAVSTDPPPTQGATTDPVQDEIDRALDSFQRGLLEETAVGAHAGVEVRMRLTGEVVAVNIAEHVPLRYDVERMGELIARAMQAASAYAAERRAELAENVTFFGEPALPRVRTFAAEPEQAVQEMAAVRHW